VLRKTSEISEFQHPFIGPLGKTKKIIRKHQAGPPAYPRKGKVWTDSPSPGWDEGIYVLRREEQDTTHA